MLNSYLGLNFGVVHAGTNNRYVNDNDLKLVNLGPIALFSNHKLTTCSRKHLQAISHAHIVSLMDKLKTSARGSDDLPVVFVRDRNRRQRELTSIKNQKGVYHTRTYLKDLFRFAKHQKKLLSGSVTN